MIAMGLTISFHEDEPIAAYLTFPHPLGTKVSRTRRMEPDILVDLDRAGGLLGIEMLDPRRVTLSRLNRIMDRLRMPRIKREWVRPLRAA